MTGIATPVKHMSSTDISYSHNQSGTIGRTGSPLRSFSVPDPPGSGTSSTPKHIGKQISRWQVFFYPFLHLIFSQLMLWWSLTQVKVVVVLVYLSLIISLSLAWIYHHPLTIVIVLASRCCLCRLIGNTSKLTISKRFKVYTIQYKWLFLWGSDSEVIKINMAFVFLSTISAVLFFGNSLT